MREDAKKKILLIDDEPGIILLFKFNLTKSGFEVLTAGNGKEALKILSEFNPDLILSDIMMPVMDGFEFREKILENNEYKKIPFVFLTAKGEEDDINYGYDLDIEDYILKTSSPNIVIKKINAILKSFEKGKDKAVKEISQAANNMKVTVVTQDIPAVNGFEILQWHQPYKDIPGGDFIDYIKPDENKTIIILGDVMGKKWEAWYFAYAYAGYVRSAIRLVIETLDEYTPSVIMEKVNNSVCEDERISEVFTTLSILIIDTQKNILSYSGAGDLPLLIKKNNSIKIESLKSNGLLLGFSKSSKFNTLTVDMEKGDTALLFTDGIHESKDINNIQFGMERLIEVAESFSGEGNIIELIRKNLTNFTSGNFDDDISIIEIKKIN